jgi:hypothetical protein
MITMIFITMQAIAADENIRTCTLTNAFACTSDDGCKEVSIKELLAPRFIRIDLKTKTISSLDRNIARDNTKIAAIEHLKGMLVMQGTEQRGWSITIGDDSGELTLSASGDGESVVVFGSCLNP